MASAGGGKGDADAGDFAGGVDAGLVAVLLEEDVFLGAPGPAKQNMKN